MKTIALALAILLSTTGAAQAQMACLIEGQVMSEHIKDCTQTSLPVPAAEYAAQCNETAAAFKQMGGAATASVLKVCPSKAQAACVGLFGQPASAYYYGRSPQLLADSKKGCVAQRGKWVDQP